ncbi:hypothetical protein MKW92_011552 [Papaver armeniacum]|nr:hypothetical protein MKW92_011552 [Papaver armeniacum]
MGLKFHVFKIQAAFGSPLTSNYGVHASPQQGNESVAKVDRASINNDPDREKADKLEALEKRVSGLLEQLDREKNDKQALEKRVSDLTEQFNQDKKALEKQVNELTLKLEECCGGAKGGSADE